MVEHVNIPDSELHEPKGVAGATVNQTYVANGAGSGSWTEPEPKGVRGASANEVYLADGSNSGTMTSTDELVRMGFWVYADDATGSSAISLTPTGVDVVMTNDEADAATNKTYKLSDVTDLWNEITDRFDFTGMSLGDTVDVQINISVTTSTTDTDIVSKINLGIGGTPYSIVIDRTSYKTAGTYDIVKTIPILLKDSNTLSNPASITLSSDSGTATAVVNEWAVRAFKKGF